MVQRELPENELCRNPEGHLRLRRRIALLGALAFLIPFGLYMALVLRIDPPDLRVILLYASPFLALGVVLVTLAWSYAMNSNRSRSK